MEIELKFALLPDDPAALEQRLARIPMLRRRKAKRSFLHNTYFDTADQQLRRHQTALRVRQIGSGAKSQWLQTLKMGRSTTSALSQRGEWEFPIAGNALNSALLVGTPWQDFDPHGEVFAALTAQFVIAFERSTWTVSLPDGSCVEIALDIGTVKADGISTPICELELELLAGEPDALFVIARQISQFVSLIPLHWSKSERGYQMAQGVLNTPLRSHPAVLERALAVPEVAAFTLREMFLQFTANLNHLRASDDPELVHQARIGWRRFKSALRLFGKHPGLVAAPSSTPLQPLLQALARLRDLEVVVAETLPQYARAYTAGDPLRQAQWRAMEQALTQALAAHRRVALDALNAPAVGATLVELTHWLELQVPGVDSDPDRPGLVPAAKWIQNRLARLHTKLKEQLAESGDAEVQHRIRLLSKRLRYCVEALRPLLPQGKARRWLRMATGLQENIGAVRDIVSAAETVTRLHGDSGVAEFLRGVAFGYRLSAPQRQLLSDEKLG